MKLFRKTIEIRTKGYNDFIDITSQLEKVVKESKIKKGMLFANSLHNTAALIIQENDPTIFEDMKNLFEKILPLNGKYEHDYEGNENATSHQKNSLLGNSISIPIENNELVLGTWQRVIFIEFFEPRIRKVVVTILGE